MKQSQFLGWVKKAYPEVNYNTREDGDIWFSSGRFLQVSASTDGTVIFFKGPTGVPEACNVDSDIVNKARELWGNPKVAFVIQDGSEKKKNQSEKECEIHFKNALSNLGIFEDLETDKKPKEEKKEESYTRDSIVQMLKKDFPDSIEIVNIAGGKVIKSDSGYLKLYDLGISSKPSEFVPWARQDEVEKIVNKFISINKSKNE